MSVHRHALLKRELEAVERRLKHLDGGDALETRHADEADQRVARLDSEAHVMDRARLAHRRRLVLAALTRIEDGAYGLCLACGVPIGAKRLDAMPWVERCLGCQAALELHEDRLRAAAGLPRPAPPADDQEPS